MLTTTMNRGLLVFGVAALVTLSGCTQQKTSSTVRVPTAKPASPAPSGGSVRTTGGTTRTAGGTTTSGSALPSAGVVSGRWPSRRSTDNVSWNALAFPSGDPKSSPLGIEKGMPKEIMANQPFDYEIVVTNLTNQTLNGVTVTDRLGGNARINRSTPSARTEPGGLIAWDIGDLAPGASRTIAVNASATSEGRWTSCASADYEVSLCSTAQIVQPALKVALSGPSQVLTCDEIEYRVEVMNTGSGTVRNVQINEPLPAGLSTVSGKRNLSIDVGELGPGQTRKFLAKLQAERTGEFQMKTRATGAGGLQAESTMVRTVVQEPVLAIDVTCSGKQFSNRPLEYAIKVTNTGNGVARNAIIESAIPAGASFVNASASGRSTGSTVRWQLGNLQPGATQSVQMQLQSTQAKVFNTTAMVKADCARQVSDSCQTEVTGIPAILLEVIDVDDPIQVGAYETYIITVTNQGTAPATGIRIACTLERNQEFIEGSGATRATGSGQSASFAPLPSLAPKDKATFRVRVRNTAAGDVRFSVSMTSDQLTRPVQETEATYIYE